MARRHKFTKDELDQYFDRVCIPRDRRIYDVSTVDSKEQLQFLNILQKHHLCKVPWENLVQHYSWHQTVHLRPAHLFNKIVKQPGRGGYCMENNFFYQLILYSLGFQTYMGGSRIYNAGAGLYGGWTHVINLVVIGAKKYLLDSGFGGQGPTFPVPLDDGVVSTQIAPAQLRLVHEPIPNNLDQTQKVWIYQHRFYESSPWIAMYCFVDFEFTPEDIGTMNFAPWLNRHTFFTHKVVCVRFTTDREKDSPQGPGSPDETELEGEIDGSLTVNHDVLKWRKGGDKIVTWPFKKDSERVEAFEKYFGIHLAEEDREAIVNTAAMINVRAMGQDDD